MRRLVVFVFSIILILGGIVLPKKSAHAWFFDFLYTNTNKLEVKGKNIEYNGEKKLLRGVAVGSPYYREEYEGRGVGDFAEIKNEWRANTVRLSVHPGIFKQEERDMKAYLESEVEAARNQGLFVIIDWHAIGFPDGWHKPWNRNRFGDDYFGTNLRNAETFWKYIARKYRGDRGVLFEIWNEPADKSRTIDWSDLRPYMDRLYGVIRSQGADNIIVAPGVFWSYDLRGIRSNPLNGSNISYAWHNYPGSGKSLRWDNALDGLHNSHPIIVTEWGFDTDPYASSHFYSRVDDWPRHFKNYIIEKDLNFTAWCWHSDWQPNMFNARWDDVTDFGQFVKDFLHDNGGVSELDIIEGEMSSLSAYARNAIIDFVKYGVDENSRRLGRGERLAVIFSYRQAYGRLPYDGYDMDDVVRIANGRWPQKRNASAEARAKANFRNVYKREANMSNTHDEAAVVVMAYGLRQKWYNRNLESERWGLTIFGNIYNHNPDTTEEWNILQAITYSGATR